MAPELPRAIRLTGEEAVSMIGICRLNRNSGPSLGVGFCPRVNLKTTMRLGCVISISCALLLTVSGCERSSRSFPAEPAREPEKADLDRRAELAESWIRGADVVVETVAVPRGTVRIIRPQAAAGTNIQFRALPEALRGQKHSTAVVIIPKYVDDENMTNAVTALTKAGLTVRIVFEGWGRRFPGPQI
jgi:hypothetical protein